MGVWEQIGSLKDALSSAVGPQGAELISTLLAKANLGDLQSILNQLQQSGLSDQVKSWLSNGPNLAITPELTVQYYGSPFIGTGRYTSFKQATDTLAQANADRFHLYGPGEIAYRAADNAYVVTEAGGAPAYTFANPDFSFRQFRSNLVARWEWRPGSSLYLVWSQGRTAAAANWVPSFATNWDQLWSTRPDNVFLVKVSYWFSP